jgi:hypothetical protein
MAERKSFLLRIDADVLDAVRHWADADLRSLNGQIEFLLRNSLRQTGRLSGGSGEDLSKPDHSPEKPESNS